MEIFISDFVATTINNKENSFCNITFVIAMHINGNKSYTLTIATTINND